MAMTHEELISMMAKAIPVMPDELASKHFDMYPTWESVVGKEITQDMIDRGFDRYQYNGILYKVLQPHKVQEDWTPESAPSLWAKVLIPNPDIIPAWEQPDSTNAYSKGDKVAHNDKTWESLADGNVWEPGAVGTESLWKEM